jgi:hypothetical protein
MIFFYPGETCPDGAKRAKSANGRMLLAVNDAGSVGKTHGHPLADQEERKHSHESTLSVTLSSHHISGASSCCNGQATKHGTYSKKLTTKKATSNLPFVQLLVCEAK